MTRCQTGPHGTRGRASIAIGTVFRHAARHGRSRTHGRQHRAAAGARRAFLRRLRPQCRRPRDAGRRGLCAGARTSPISSRSSKPPRAVWLMLPAGAPTEETIAALGDLLERGDAVLDGGNSFYRDDIAPRRHCSREGHRLRRRRHVGRRVGPRARLLPDDRRRRKRSSSGSIRSSQALAPGRSGDRADAGPRGPRPRAPSAATSMPARSAPGISSRWSTTASSMA